METPLSSTVGAFRHLAALFRRSRPAAPSPEDLYLAQALDAADFERRARQLDCRIACDAGLRLSFMLHARP